MEPLEEEEKQPEAKALPSNNKSRTIVVTGANKGIGYRIC